MRIETLTLAEWEDALPSTGFEWTHNPERFAFSTTMFQVSYGCMVDSTASSRLDCFL